MDVKLARELVKTRKAVQKKYRALKSELAESESKLQKQMKPIAEPLQKLLERVEPIKPEPSIKVEQGKAESATSTPKKTRGADGHPLAPPTGLSFLEDTFSNIPQLSNIADISTVEENVHEPSVVERENQMLDESIAASRANLRQLINTPAYADYLEAYHPLPRQYVDDSIRGNEEEFDRYYGLTHDMTTEEFTLGKTPVRIDGADIIIQNVRYPGTAGLYELLFKKHPVGYNHTDLEQYMDMLKRTNAYRRNFDPTLQIQGTQSAKYKQVIKPYLLKHGILKHPTFGASSTGPFEKPLPPKSRLRKTQSLKHTGHGLMRVSDRPVEYVYFNDPNELVTRLRVLLASQYAGNHSHQNEIQSILEELREDKFIK